MARRRVLVAHLLTGRLAGEIDGLRRALGSGEIERITPHVTLVPPRNVDADLDPVLEHVRHVAGSRSPGSVRLVGARVFPPARRVVHLGVEDRDGIYRGLASSLATGPLAPPEGRAERGFVAHVTLTSRAAPEVADGALASLGSFRAEVNVHTLSVLVLDEDASPPRWRSVGAVALGPPMTSGRGGIEVEIVAATPSESELARVAVIEPAVSIGYVARVEGNVVGVVVAELSGEALTLRHHAVDPTHHSEGIGTRLLSALEARAAELGLCEVSVVVTPGTRAASYYVGRGYSAPSPADASELLVRRVAPGRGGPDRAASPGTVS